jgi:hypothetical protein
LYFWIIPAVIISSIIGVSQTENAIPRILGRFRNEVYKEFPGWLIDCELKLPEVDSFTTERRERSGGIYSWQPGESRTAVIEAIRSPFPSPKVDELKMKRREKSGGTYSRIELFEAIRPQAPKKTGQRLRWLFNCIELRPGSPVFPLIIFTYGALTGILISFLVPPEGFDCRHAGEIAIALAWVISACLNNLPLFPHLHSNDEILATRARRNRFLFILYKDIFMTAATMGGIIFTQIGVFNQCACYTLWGRTGLALPEIPAVSKTLFWRINTSYPAIAFLCVGFQLVVVPSLLLRQYGLAVRVFLQRDDDLSNMPRWVVKFCEWANQVWEEAGESTKARWHYVGMQARRFRKKKSGLVTPTYSATEHLDPESTWRGKASDGEVSVNMVEYRQSDGSDRIEPNPP